VLSYSRLFALGLATGVIGTVVNAMSSMLGGSFIGNILMVFFMIFGHTFNIAINVLGAYVHSSRLQYVEFFGKFFEGDGKPFVPFKTLSKYTR
jgi:V/A-type H+-transporting ATPase subunit I